jgi:putative oxidoreductase
MSPSTVTQAALALAGRLLIASLFIPEGLHQAAGFAGTVGYISSRGVPFPEAAAAISIVAHLGLPLALLAGWQARWAALGLAVFTLAITAIFHDFWAVPAAQAAMQRISFFKNLAIVGGLLGFIAWGPGAWSVDGRRGRA